MKIVFMGTPAFAVPSLNRLYGDGHEIAAVFTRPDRPSGRGHKLTPPPVKQAAGGRSLVHQPASLRGGDAEEVLRSLAPDLIVVVAYGLLLPREILELSRFGCVNIHASLLPRWRGAAPVQRAILGGDTVTGVTSMYMAEELDAGDVIFSKKTEIGETETSGALLERLSQLGAELLSETVSAIAAGTAPRTPQDPSLVSYAPPLTRELSPIDWWQYPNDVLRRIRALDPWPSAKTELQGVEVRVFAAERGSDVPSAFPGEIVSAGKDGIELACFDGSVRITELQAPNGRRMSAADYLRGHAVKVISDKAVVRKISLPENGRTICISDIHGAFDAFRALLDKINFSENDTLILLGDFYTKGRQGRETLEYIMEQGALPNVYALRGNCDWVEPWADAAQRTWLEALPHILESDEFIFVHGGIGPGELTEQRAIECMKNDAWLDKCGAFDRWVVTGHWPTMNYANLPRSRAARISSVNSAELSSTCDGVFSCDPVIDAARRVIAIDGGMVVKPWGQLNAFIIERGGFSFEAVDFMPIITAEKDQSASENPHTITYNDRFIKEVPDDGEPGAEFAKYLHLATGKTIELPRDDAWRDEKGRLCNGNGTDYRLPVRAGDKMSLLREYGDRLFVKKDGQIGWVFK